MREKTIEFLKRIKEIPVWDRCPAITTDELDAMIADLEGEKDEDCN